MDKEFLYDLMAEFEKRNIQELSFKSEQCSIRLLKAALPQPLVSATAVPATVAPVQAAAPGQGAEGGVEEGAEIIKAPIVGNFYRQPAPDAPYFVNEGARVNKGQVLCILEAMKLLNEMQAEFDCEIVKVLVENGAMVEYGTPLFEVRRI